MRKQLLASVLVSFGLLAVLPVHGASTFQWGNLLPRAYDQAASVPGAVNASTQAMYDADLTRAQTQLIEAQTQQQRIANQQAASTQQDQRWTFIGEYSGGNKSGNVYVDSKTIIRTDSSVKCWTSLRYDKYQNGNNPADGLNIVYDEAWTSQEVFCSNRTRRIGYLVLLNRGNQLAAFDPKLPQQPIIPGSAAEITYLGVCESPKQ